MIERKGIQLQGAPMYLDMQATTPMDPRVVDAMLPFMTEQYGNPHSRTHLYGWEAEDAVEAARAQVGALIGAEPKEIIFTSGATESNNMAVKGVAQFYKDKKRHVITTQVHPEAAAPAVVERWWWSGGKLVLLADAACCHARSLIHPPPRPPAPPHSPHPLPPPLQTDHKCVLDSCRYLQQRGFDVTYLPVQKNGLVDMQQLADAIRPDTSLVRGVAGWGGAGGRHCACRRSAVLCRAVYYRMQPLSPAPHPCCCSPPAACTPCPPPPPPGSVASGVGDGGEQRDRRGAAAGGHRCAVPRQESLLPYRRGAGAFAASAAPHPDCICIAPACCLHASCVCRPPPASY